jgi:hypothetical protein
MAAFHCPLSSATSKACLMPRNRASGETQLRVISPAAVTEPTARIALRSTAMSKQLPDCAIHEATISGVLLASHRVRIVESFRWSATHSSVINRLSTSPAATASRFSIGA